MFKIILNTYIKKRIPLTQKKIPKVKEQKNEKN
jgi:hypothetical protein